jgi:general secretion pathway protein G
MQKVHITGTKQAGFSFIEIMVVVVIIGILVGLLAPKLMGRPDEAKIVAAKADIRTIVGQLKLYRLDNGNLPTTAQGLQALVTKPTSEPVPGKKWRQYLDRLPQDPWDNDYQYINPGVHGEFDVFSLGADHAPGGDGKDADIGSWEK